MIDPRLILLLLVGGFVGAAAGYLGSFMVLKRMALVGDALSHVALPGMAIALAWNFSPILGAFVALTIAVFGIWYLGKTSQIYPEALVGIFFTTSLALGVLITPQPDLLEALFGSIEKINTYEGLMTIILSLSMIVLTQLISNQLILGSISDELAKSVGISIEKINLIYLILVGMIVALGVRFIGTLLMGGLVIIPAVSAKNVSLSIKSYCFLATLFGVVSSLVGILVANFYHLAPGPIVVLTSIVIFVLTYSIKESVLFSSAK